MNADMRPRRRYLPASLLGVAMAASLFGPGAALAATPVQFGPNLNANGWRLMTFPRRAPAQFTAAEPGTLAVRADRGVAVLWRQITPAVANPVNARWRWRVESSVGPTDLARKGGDDRALAVYFVFSDTLGGNEPIDLGNAMRSGQANILIYVWGGSAPKGRVLASPYLGRNGRTIVLQSAADTIGNWTAERVDLSADYRKAFGGAAPTLVAVAVSSDSDDTSGINVGAVGDLTINP
ncbi:MAG: DUF3047 domain-containing protein [Pseudolabrys sp.]|nr:DUF3047 domain-containing protein [Pseudolabrys sp.]